MLDINKFRINVFFVLILITSCARLPNDTRVYREDAVSYQINQYNSEKNGTKSNEGSTEKNNHNKLSNTDLSSTLFLNFDLNHSSVKFWIDYFLKQKNKERTIRHLKNGRKYKKLVQSILDEHNLPKDLYYLGLIESGYHSSSRSHAGAVGPWQFIRGTGLRYGLRINRQIDERRSIFKATKAAALYLRDLHNIFGDWALAMASYNAGEYKILNSIKKGRTRDYRKLITKKILPKETRFYVPKLVAIRHIDQNAQSFGLNLEVETWPKETDFTSLEINRPFRIADLSSLTGVDGSIIRNWNRDMKNKFVLASKKHPYRIFLPQIDASILAKLDSDLPKVKLRNDESPKYKNLKYAYHQVRKGDNLSLIAAKYSMGLSQLKRINHIRRDKIVIGQKLKVVSKDIKVNAPSSGFSYHQIKSGENLTVISKKYGIKIADIMKVNQLNSPKLLVGQRLKLPLLKNKAKSMYVVKKGDSLFEIATRFGISIKKLMEFNSLEDKTIFPNQKLYIPKIAYET